MDFLRKVWERARYLAGLGLPFKVALVFAFAITVGGLAIPVPKCDGLLGSAPFLFCEEQSEPTDPKILKKEISNEDDQPERSR